MKPCRGRVGEAWVGLTRQGAQHAADSLISARLLRPRLLAEALQQPIHLQCIGHHVGRADAVTLQAGGSRGGDAGER